MVGSCTGGGTLCYTRSNRLLENLLYLKRDRNCSKIYLFKDTKIIPQSEKFINNKIRSLTLSYKFFNQSKTWTHVPYPCF